MNDNSSHMLEDQKLVYWLCDKVDCNRANYRTIKSNHIIYYDKCVFCFTSIHEPITFNVSFLDNTDTKHE